MSFLGLKKEELETIASELATEEIPENANRKDIIDSLESEGINWQFYKDAVNRGEATGFGNLAPVKGENEKDFDNSAVNSQEEAKNTEEAASDEPEQPRHLVKMTRKNFSFRARGYKFTREHPYALVKEEDVEHFVNERKGFALATPEEARRFYN